jgi:hypothetical protein
MTRAEFANAYAELTDATRTHQFIGKLETQI